MLCTFTREPEPELRNYVVTVPVHMHCRASSQESAAEILAAAYEEAEEALMSLARRQHWLGTLQVEFEVEDLQVEKIVLNESALDTQSRIQSPGSEVTRDQALAFMEKCAQDYPSGSDAIIVHDSLGDFTKMTPAVSARLTRSGYRDPIEAPDPGGFLS
jgi:hypothetical protein